MREVFKGWRRKAGCITLVMASAFAGGWVRSQAIQDDFSLIALCRHTHICLAEGHISITYGDDVIWYVDDPQPTFWEWPRWRQTLLNTSSFLQDGPLFFRHARLGGNVIAPATRLTLPYRTLTIPLTLASAYLILWKPRKATVQ